jgi:1-deoxy-D-xylulose-5-phosphate synthase
VAIYSSFLQRADDQLVHDVALQNLPVVFAIDRAGLVGGDGATHQGSYDLSFMRCIPNMVIMAPSNEDECRQMLYTATTLESPAAVRYPRGTGRGVAIQEEMRALPVGKGVLVREGRSGLALLAFGSLVASAEAIGERLDATVVNMRFVKPLDSELVDRIAGKNQYIITLEENAIAGGAGSAVGELLASLGHRSALLHIGIPDRAIMHGTRENCLAEADLDSASLQRQIDAWWQPRLLRLAEIG